MKDDQILQLTTGDEQSQARTALSNAIAEAKASDLLKQPGAPNWSDLVWKMDALANRGSAATQRCSVFFRAVGADDTEPDYPAYWSDVLKLLVVRRLQNRFDIGQKFSPGAISVFQLAARSFLDRLRANGIRCITEVTKIQVLNAFANCVSEGDQSILKRVVIVLVETGIAPQLAGLKLRAKWKNRNKVDPSSVKPTSYDDIVALAATYQLLEPEDSPLKDRSDFDYLRCYMAMANLLACAPSRTSELWRLPADTAILTSPLEDPSVRASVPDDQRDALDFKFAMTWYPSKNGKPVIKPVPGAMQFVATRCLEILASYSEAPRQTARFIMDNPGVMPIPEELKNLRAYRDIEKARIHTNEIAALFGVPEGQIIATSSIWRCFIRTRRTAQRDRKGNEVTYCFRTLQEEWWLEFQRRFKQAFKSDWPYAVKASTYQLTADRALLVCFNGMLETRVKMRAHQNQLFLTTPSRRNLDNLLGISEGKATPFWARLNIRLPNGELPIIKTHQLRHFLNTMAQRAGLPQAVIAMWSGRIDIAQNATYDHRTDTERLRAHGYNVSDYDEMQVDDLLNRQMDQLYAGKIGLPSPEVLLAPEGGIRELEKRRIVSITQYGYCVGDLQKDPCPKAVNCLSCSRLVVCKGAEKATEFLEQKVEKLEAQKAEVERHVMEENGWRLGSEQILPLLEKQICGAKNLLMTLRDPDVPDGAMIAMREQRGAQTASLADRAREFIAQRKALEAKQKEIYGA